MKHFLIVIFVLLIFAGSGFAQKRVKSHPQQTVGFVISGNIPGIKNGVAVRLINGEILSRRTDIASGVTKGSSFRLVGKVASPTRCQLQIEDRIPKGKDDYARETGIDMFVENVKITVSAAHYDSIPLAWDMYSIPLRKEFNVKVSGGLAERQFAEYRRFIHDAELKAKVTDYAVRDYQFNFDEKNKHKVDSVVLKQKEALAMTAQQQLNEANDHFMNTHPTYAISLWLAQQKLEQHFVYPISQFDKWIAQFKGNTDTARYQSFVAAANAAKKFAQGTHYTDFTVVTTDSVTKKLSDFITKGNYTLVDFWASWCGPCRASIPHVKEMYAKYGKERLNIVSVSCDQSKKDWYSAVDAEKMAWQQLLLPREAMQAVRDAYQLSGIPYLLLINAQGELVYAANSSDEVGALLQKIMK